MKAHDWLQLNPMVRVALALIAGVVAGNSLGLLVPMRMWLVASLAALCITIGGYLWKTVQGIGILCTVMCVGGMLVSRQKDGMKTLVPGGEQLSEAVVMTAPKVRGKVVQCDLYVMRGPCSGQKVKASILRDTVEKRYQLLQLGGGIVFRSAFEPVRNDPSNVRFDARRWMAIHGYRAQTFIHHRHWVPQQLDLSTMPRMERLRLKAQKVRNNLLRRYSASGLDDQNYAVVAAMTVGDKSFLSKETKTVFSVSGASHVLALSGLHLSILFGLLMVVFGRKAKRLTVSISMIMLTVWVYVFLTGLSSSVMRSAIMLTVYALASLLHRGKMSLNVLAFTAVIMLLLSPLILWDVSFQLSFMAVLAILLLERPIYQWVRGTMLEKTVVGRRLWGMTAVSLAAQVGTAPLVAYYFGRFSCYFLLTNLVVIPLTVVILYTACLWFVLSFATVLQGGVSVVLFWLVQLLNRFLVVVASWPGASIEGICLSHWQVLLVYVLLTCICGFAYYARKGYGRSRIS